jgi:hypothetical protein
MPAEIPGEISGGSSSKVSGGISESDNAFSSNTSGLSGGITSGVTSSPVFAADSSGDGVLLQEKKGNNKNNANTGTQYLMGHLPEAYQPRI